MDFDSLIARWKNSKGHTVAVNPTDDLQLRPISAVARSLDTHATSLADEIGWYAEFRQAKIRSLIAGSSDGEREWTHIAGEICHTGQA